jgi:hypothetical protein
MAAKSAPPAKAKWGKYLILLILSLGLLTADPAALKLVGFLGVVGFGYLMSNSIKFNGSEYPRLYRIWTESWVCNKCGNFYHQP